MGDRAVNLVRKKAVEVVAKHLWMDSQADPDDYKHWDTVGKHVRATYLDIADDIIVALNRAKMDVVSCDPLDNTLRVRIPIMDLDSEEIRSISEKLRGSLRRIWDRNKINA